MASTISVALVLLILGILAAISIATGKITTSVLGQVSVIVKVSPLSSEAETEALGIALSNSSFASSCTFTSADEVLAQEMDRNQEVLDMIGENPYTSEYEVRLAPAYVHPDSILEITNRLSLLNNVDEVLSQTETVKAVASAAKKTSLVLSAVAFILLVISIVLIFNTVSIAVYGRRFVIRTMQLVGATPGFIRRPFVVAGVVAGILAGLIASAILIGGCFYISSLSIDLDAALSWPEIGAICAGMTATGIAICAVSAVCATNKYLRASYDTLYS